MPERWTWGATVHANGTVSVLKARIVVAALERRGIDDEPVLRDVQLSRQALAWIETRVRFDAVSKRWEFAAVAAVDSAFGGHAAEGLPTGGGDVFDYFISSAATLGESLSRVAQYSRICDGQDLVLTVEPRHARLVRFVQTP